MKKVLSLVLVFALCLCVSGCGKIKPVQPDNDLPAAEYTPPKTGIIFLGYYDSFEDFKASEDAYADSALGEVSPEQFIAVSEGHETFAILPAENIKRVCVYSMRYDEEGNGQKDLLLYDSTNYYTQPLPIVVKGNLSDIMPDFAILVTNQSSTSGECCPKVSMKDGKLEIITEQPDYFEDLTMYK